MIILRNFKKLVSVVIFVGCIVEITGQISTSEKCYDNQLGTTGFCAAFSTCQTAKTFYSQTNTYLDLCEYDASDPVVCCPDLTIKDFYVNIKPQIGNLAVKTEPTEEEEDLHTRTQTKGLRTSQKKCVDYHRELKETVGFLTDEEDPALRANRKATCFTTGGFVVGGRETLVGEFPFMAAIGWPTGLEDPQYKWLCGGTLISENFVLSAGHCIYTARTDITSPEPKVVRLGDHNLRQNVEDLAYPQTYEIRKIIKHPEYRPPRKYNDLALFQIDRIQKFNFYMRPACLWQEQRSYENITFSTAATGWGVIKPKDMETSDVLMTVELRLFNNTHCATKFETNRNWRGFEDTQICAGDQYGSKDTCQGDSGGPLSIRAYFEKELKCVFYVVAVTSFGSHCGAAGGSGVYTKVYPYLDWIEQQVWP